MGSDVQQPQPGAFERTSSQARVFRYLLDQDGPRTKQEIATDLGLSLPTVYQALSNLEDQHLIRPSETRASTGGRRATPFCPDEEGPMAVGASITGDRLRLAAVDLRGSCIATTESALLHPGALQPVQLGELIRTNVELFCKRPELADRTLAGVRIAAPIVINPADGTVVSATAMGYETFDIADLVRDYDCPVGVENDADCGGYAESLARDGLTSLAYLSLERGVGGTIIFNGQPYAGLNGRSGEFGHICVEPGGRPCACGGRGHLESYCSTACLSDDLGLTLDEFFEQLAADPTDPMVAGAWESFASHLAQGIATIRMALDTTVVIGGLLAHYLADHLDEIRARTAALDPFSSDARYVELSLHPYQGVPLGAALKALTAFVETV